MEDFSVYNGEGTELRKIQLRLLHILIEFDKICRRHKLVYWLDGGTLLGAKRHGGFIPWDDDLDIGVLGSDMEEIKKWLVAELPEDLFYHDTDSDPYFYLPIGRVKDLKSKVNDPLSRLQNAQGLQLDVLPYDKIPSIRTKNIINFFYRRAYREIHHYSEAQGLGFFRRTFNVTMGYLLYPISKLSKKIACWSMTNSTDCKICMYGSNFPCRSYKDTIPVSEIEFEGYKFLAPYDVDSYLTETYGDYMKVPKVEDRPKHFTECEMW